MIKRPKVLFYCQHLMGVGHLTRSFAICKELADAYQITFLQGGRDIGRIAPPGVHLVKLPPLQMDPDKNFLFDPLGDKSPTQLFAERGALIDAQLQEPYDFLFVELYPFGRKKFSYEILDLVKKVRARNPQVRVISSLRDILVEKHDFITRDKKIAQVVRDYFDYVLVHSDPDLIQLNATFSQVPAIQDKLIYTGYISEEDGENLVLAERQPRILVSQGGGVVGGELFLAALATVDIFPNYEFAFIVGPNADPSLRERIARAEVEKPNVKLYPFSQNFEAELAKSALSISLAGYNTMMNLLHTRTPAIVYPFAGNQEQSLRAQLLSKRGFVQQITAEELETGDLAALIAQVLKQPYPAGNMNLSGTRHTREFLEKLSTCEE